MQFNEREILKRNGVLLAMLVTAVVIIYALHPFIPSILGAIMFYVLFKPFHEKLTIKYRWNKRLSVLLILLLSFLVFLLPMGAVSYLLFQEAQVFVSDPTSLIDYMHQVEAFSKEKIGLELFSEKNIEQVKTSVLNWTSVAVNQTLNIVGLLGIMYFVLYYMLIHSASLVSAVRMYSPFHQRKDTSLFIEELKSQTYSNAIIIPILIVVQGTAAGLCYRLCGLEQPFFWAVITGFFSIIPVVGTAIIWIPAGVVMLIIGEPWQGWVILGFGALVISNIDNLVRLLLQKHFADVHPVITVLGVVAGLTLFGLPGLIFGPLLISYFVILVKVYRTEFWEEETKE
jgi:predicted PurR-regulated permease PerM